VPTRPRRLDASLVTHDWTPAPRRHLTLDGRQDRFGRCRGRPGSAGVCRPGKRRARGAAPPDARTWGSRRTSTGPALCGARGRSGAAARAATGRRAAGSGDAGPRVWSGFESGAVGLPQGCLAPGPGSVRIHRHAARPDARSGPTAPRGWSGAAAAARIHIADCPGVQRPASGTADGGRAASAAGVLPLERTAAARVLRHARARSRSTTGSAGSPDAVATSLPQRPRYAAQRVSTRSVAPPNLPRRAVRGAPGAARLGRRASHPSPTSSW
jgi:hypothetical protein